MDLVFEFLELLLPPGWMAVLHAYPAFLEFFLGLLAVALVYVLLARRVWRRGGNSGGNSGGMATATATEMGVSRGGE